MLHTTPLLETSLPNRLVIKTSSLQRFISFVDELLNDQEDEPTMATVTGAAGIGKTVSMNEVIRERNQIQSHTGLPPICKITVLPRPKPITIARAVARALNQKVPRTRETDEIISDICDWIARNDLRLIIVDEADNLDADCFNVLRAIFDISQCPIMLIGLSKLLVVISRHEQFDSRVGLRMEFDILDEKEVIDNFLPKLTEIYSCWKYDASDEADREMGRFLWSRVRPSLRKLRNILKLANRIAQLEKEQKINVEHIKQSMRFSGAHPYQDDDDQTEEQDPNKSSYEISSEKRKAAKLRRKTKRK